MLSRGIVHEDEVLCTAAHEKLAVALWYGEPSEFHVDKIHEVVGERVRLYSQAVLLVIIAKPVLPDPVCRRRMASVMDEFGAALLAVDVCIEVDGVFGAALRTLNRAIALSARSRTPTFFSETVDEAATQLEAYLGQNVLAAERVRQVVHGVRTKYSSRRPPAALSV